MKESETRVEGVPWILLCQGIRAIDETSLVHGPHEHLQANDGVDDDNEDDQ